MTETYRNMGGFRYLLYNTHKTREEAQKLADARKSLGHTRAALIPYSSGWGMWVRVGREKK